MARKFKVRKKHLLPIWRRELVEVSRDVYIAWYQHSRNWKYQREMDKEAGVCSLEELFSYTKDSIGAYPDLTVDIEQQVQKEIEMEALNKSLKILTFEEFALIYALYFQNESIRKYAKQLNVSHVLVLKRHNKILEKLREEMSKQCK